MVIYWQTQKEATRNGQPFHQEKNWQKTNWLQSKKSAERYSGIAFGHAGLLSLLRQWATQ